MRNQWFGYEHWYSGQTHDASGYLTSPESGTLTGGAVSAYDFAAFRPYVYVVDTKTGSNTIVNHQIRVNHESSELSGCGTYNDPYLISGSEFEMIARILAGTGEGTIALPILENNAENENTLAATKWDANGHKKYQWNGSDKYSTYTTTNGVTTYNNDGYSLQAVRKYLAGAYYKLNADITLSDGFVGLGATGDDYAVFRGVVIGGGTGKNTITNESNFPFIVSSYGSVVKNLNFVVDNTSISKTSITSLTGYIESHSNEAYGAVIGQIFGGDNIIDNVKVQFNQTTADAETGEETVTEKGKITVGGSYPYLVPVGGYVGVVVFGGLIFKNMTPEKTTVSGTNLNVVYGNDTDNLADNYNAKDWSAIYVNPIIGRVINGYAVNETETNTEKGTTGRFSQSEDGTRGNEHTLKNGTKHYTIADINKSELSKLDVTKVASTGEDGNIDVPNAQALFILSLITQSCAGTATTIGGAYVNSLSYGTYDGTVYGMSHNADYSAVGTDLVPTADNPETVEDESVDVPDYTMFASDDTAANMAVPYIIRHYTTYFYDVVDNGTNTTNVTYDRIEGTLPNNANPILIASEKASERSDLFETDGKTRYLLGEKNPDRGLKFVLDNPVGASELSFEVNPNVSNQFSISVRATGKFLNLNTKNLVLSDTREYFTLSYTSSEPNGYWQIQKINSDYYIQFDPKNTNLFSGVEASKYPLGTRLILFEKVTTTTTNHNYVVTEGYPARCVTSTLGYYDINLTGSGTYVLPDSFRGLGSVGIYNSDVSPLNNIFGVKLNEFNGNGNTIDVDIYLNKYQTDNYFNVLHGGASQDLKSDSNEFRGTGNGGYVDNNGIGLFDNVLVKQGGSIENFTLSGSVLTEIYRNDYKATKNEQLLQSVDKKNMWLSTGGVCGWLNKGIVCEFEDIKLNDLSISGSSFVGGIIGLSGLSDTSNPFVIRHCSANNISVELTAGKNLEDQNHARNGIGCFVGKVHEGGVEIYGAEDSEDEGRDLFSTVKIQSFGFGLDSVEYYVSAGGLVGFAGNCCKIYDMHLTHSDNVASVTIGNNKTRFAGGLVGGMQSQASGGKTGVAVFENCTVQEINVNGSYAGGIYGGKWNSAWTTYTIDLVNCQVIGNTSTNNEIKGNDLYLKTGFAGGLIGRAYVYENGDPNIRIQDCKVSNYDIIADYTDNKANGGYAGGFLGYASSEKNPSSVTCYIHDSSVEDCKVGSTKNYAGGAVGYLQRKNSNSTNKLLGYNIMLNNVDSDSSKMGAWIGYLDSDDNSTVIQLTGIGIYKSIYQNNVGNNVNLKTASFVFADYAEQCAYYNATEGALSGYNYSQATHVDMPKYPFVNVNPHTMMGQNSTPDYVWISGDGAAMYDTTDSMAEHIFSGITTRYTTFGNTAVEGTHTIDDYWERGIADSGDRISTYFTEKSISDLDAVENFPVVVISGKNNGDTTNLINRYIQLVTNTKTDYIGSGLTIADSRHATSEFYDIVIDNVVYNNGAFEIDNSKSPGLKLTTEQNSNYIALDGANADTQKDGYTFTLVDIQFKDPLGKEKIVYHLYVPVYTIKLMEIRFFSAAHSGTNAVGIDNYEESFGEGIAEGVDNWITQYVRYAYEKEDIQMLLNSGSLNWNFDKSFVLVTENRDTAIPIHDGTLLTLVDPNADADSVYYAKAEDFETRPHTYNQITKYDLVIKLENFKNGANNFEVKTLNELIEDLIEAEEVEIGSGAYIVTEGEYDVYAGGNRYKFVGTGNDGNINLTLKDDAGYFVNDGIKYICEDYYISQYVPSLETQTGLLYNYMINCDGTLSGEKKAIVTNPTGKQPTVLIADLYVMDKTATDKMTVTSVGNSEQISSANNKLSVTITNTITLNNEYIKPVLDSKNIYHSFVVTLNRYAEEGVRSDISILNKSSIKNLICTISEVGGESVTRQLGENDYELNYEEGYINIITGNIMNNILNAYYGNNNQKQPIVISLSFDIEFDPTQLDPYFPSKEVNDTEHQYGINVSATSNLSYNENKLANSSMNYHYTDGQYFFIPNENEALIFYYAVSELDEHDDYGRMSENKSTLGVNGYSKETHNLDYMPINTEAKYNTEKIREKLSEATRVKVTIWLKKKEDTVDNNVVTNVGYSEDLKLWDYIDSQVNFSSGTAAVTGTLTDPNATSLAVYLPKEQCKIDGDTIILNMGFKAKTGGDFHDYANYRIYLQVELADASSDFESTRVFTHLVYTNAKVYPTYFAE
ncbi:MAG: hypothetical protein IJR33_05020 [Clostridia bacterium]|nr:hypothetical protein [Clostridia bacterium]